LTIPAFVPKPEYAVVYVPKRSRSRFSATCVEVVGSAGKAMELADDSKRLFAARVNGPSKSSEGQGIYYLMEWLEQEP